jgi:hypothetical protein
MKTCCREKLEGDTSGGLFQIGKRFGCLAPYFGWKAGCAIFNESWQGEPRFSRDAVERKYSKLGSKNRQGQHLNAVEVWSVTSALGACDCLVHDPADGVRAPPALGAAAEAAIDLASRCRRSLGGDRAHVVVAQYVARTDDHGGPSFQTRFSSLCNYRHSGGLTGAPKSLSRNFPHIQAVGSEDPIEVSIRARSPRESRWGSRC